MDTFEFVPSATVWAPLTQCVTAAFSLRWNSVYSDFCFSILILWFLCLFSCASIWLVECSWHNLLINLENFGQVKSWIFLIASFHHVHFFILNTASHSRQNRFSVSFWSSEDDILPSVSDLCIRHRKNHKHGMPNWR